MQERKAELAGKRLLEIGPTSYSKKDAKENKNKKQTEVPQKTRRSQAKGAMQCWRTRRLELLMSKKYWNFQVQTRKSKEEKNGQKSTSNYKEILNEAKEDVRLIKLRLLKKYSKRANNAVDKLYGLILL